LQGKKKVFFKKKNSILKMPLEFFILKLDSRMTVLFGRLILTISRAFFFGLT
jgi:hypothetical protein